MDGLEIKSFGATKSRAVFTKFLKSRAIVYVENENQIQFESGLQYYASFVDDKTILYDKNMKMLRNGSVFEIMSFLCGYIDTLV